MSDTLRAEQERLEARVREAKDECDAVKARTTQHHIAKREAEILKPLADYWRNIRVGPDGMPPSLHGEHRSEFERLTRELVTRIEEDGLIVVPVNHHYPAQGVRIYDPRVRDELFAAEARLQRTRDDLAAWRQDNHATLEAERDAERRRIFREAVEEGDVDRLKELVA